MIYNNIKKFKIKRPCVCIQGLGVVGSAMAIAIASSRNKRDFNFNLIGIEKNDKQGLKIISNFNSGKFPFSTTDRKILKLTNATKKNDNFFATTNIEFFKESKIIISSIGLDFFSKKNSSLINFKNSIKDIARRISPNALFILESSVPPGTTEKIVMPIFSREFKKRRIPLKKIHIAYSYERVMPGANYINSITNYWRVYSAINKFSKNKCYDFFSKIINTKKYPLTFLSSITSCETSKILENTYRALNIALIDEWSRFAEENKLDLFEIIEAIKLRPTHSNIMNPGFGVGGYCLTKDPYFVDLSSKKVLKSKNLKFPLSKSAVFINNKMPYATYEIIKKNLKKIKNKKILILGSAYKGGIDDVRFSPTEILVKKLLKYSCQIFLHDPVVKSWPKYKNIFFNKIPKKIKYDAIVLAVRHPLYKKLNLGELSIRYKTIIIDANNVIKKNTLIKLVKKNFIVFSIGRGFIE